MFKINNNDFKILDKYKSFLNDLDDILENVPRKDLYFKDKLRDVAYVTMENIIKCNNDRDNISKYVPEIKGGIASIDFMLERLYDKRYINEKALYLLGVKLVEINKMTGSWLANGSKS